MADYEFTPAFGNRPTQLVGREQDLEAILQGLGTRPGSKGRAVVMLGQRGYGKTVMLWELADRAREQGFAVATPTSVREGLLDRVVEKLQEDAEGSVGRQPRVTGATVGAFGVSASLEFTQREHEMSTEYRLTSLCRKIDRQNMGGLILIDEPQANDTEIRRLVGTYQELVGEGLDVALVMAGLPASVSSVLNDRVLTFLNRAYKLRLGPLANGDVDAFYKRAFAASHMAIPARLRRAAAASTEGSPYLMQLIGHYLVAYAEDGTVTEESFGEALESARDEFENDVCTTTLAALSAKDCAYLLSMAKIGGICRTADVAARMGVSADYGQQYRRRLLDAGVIEAPRKGSVRFAIPYLEDYLRRL